uniref:Eukaryotic translation initiation factor 3 subunit A n=1 Tax=Globodera pallida TaxID=36090 RepID=A0A183BYF1_GLOPA
MRPNYQGQKPEAALQRAHDFLSVGKQKDALQALHDLIKDRRHKQWTQTYEQIMLLYIELCVNLRNSALVKDGLYQYKIITQQVSVKSLESVLEKFLQLAEQKALEAQKHSIEKIDEIDDLDVADAPENLLLSVSGAVAQDRMDRTVLSPWLRFLWDAYRNCLDLLRNNVYVESLYHQIARQSFAFCTKYQRRNEFRKLCEMLRQHLVQIQKAQLSTAMHPIRLSNTESLGHMLETRLIQLDTAINMDLWQEAFKSAEDLHGFMQLVKEKDKKIIRPTSYANYYDKISMVFWKGGNTLFHAAALLQRFCIYKDMRRQFADEDAMDQATRVLLATLSIPEGAEGASLLAKHLDIEEQHLANVRVLSSLLRLPITPSRSGIIKEIVRLNIPELASPAAYELYKCVEMEFNPLRIAPNVQKHLADIDKLGHVEYSQYADSVKSVVTTRILKKLSALYETLSLKRLQKLIPFYDPIELEQKLVNVCKQQSLKARVDHRSECIRFGHMEIALANDLESEMETNVTEVEKARTHLDELYTQLGNIQLSVRCTAIESDAKKSLKRQIFVYKHQKDSDFERVLARRKRIELHKENTEQVRREKLQKEQAHANKQEELRRRDELKKLQEENKENEKRRKLNEQEELQRKLNSEKLKKYQVHPFFQQLVKEHGEEIFESGDPDQLIKEKRLRFDAERREQQTKLQNQEKKYDHTVRAFHFEEMALWKELSEERQKTFPEMHEAYETKRIEEAIKEHERSFETYACLVKAKEDAKEFMRSVILSHADEFKDQKVAWKQRVDETRKKLLKERAERRKEQRKKEAKEAEMRKQQEEQRRLEDEKRVADQQKREQQQPKRQQQPEETTVRRREQAVVGGGASGEQMWRSEKPAAAAAVEKRPVPVARDEQQQRQPLQVPQKAKYVPPSMRNK